VKTRTATPVPWLICAVVIVALWGLQGMARVWPRLDLLTRLEWIAYDWRVRLAAAQFVPGSARLGFVAISDESIEAVQDGMFGALPYRFGLYWPRQVYGRLVHELAAQGAAAVGLDILFAELRPDHPALTLPDGRPCGSDQFFAAELRQAGNVILASDRSLPPQALFRTNALMVADISAQRESDGILRRARAYQDVWLWHPLVLDAARLLGWDLRQARVERGRLMFPVAGGGQRVLRLDEDNNFDQVALFEEVSGQQAPGGAGRKSAAFTRLRCWQMGIALAARALQLDLASARVEPEHHRIVLAGPGGVRRVIPIDGEGRFYIDWSLTPYHQALTRETIESLLLQYEHRQAGRISQLTNRWKDHLVVVGSVATGNDLTDLGATPLEKETYLISQQWNVANSVLSGRFIRPPSLALEWALVLALGALAGWMSWRWRALASSAGVLAGAAIYVGFAVWAYLQWRWWLPVVVPVGGSMLVLHASLATFRVLHEQRERRRIEDIFGHMVSPKVRDELIKARSLALGGVRREITVFFADLRGFTRMTEASQAAAEDYVSRCRLSEPASRAYLERQSQEVLATVNLYLGLIADKVKQYDGTLDKYIGDCVMAFWGAPTPNDTQAAVCVRAMIDAQRAIGRINQERAAANQARSSEPGKTRDTVEEPAPPLPLLQVGIGINTGLATVGLIGSEQNLLSYTVFGREVNVACRLEEIAGPGRILVAERTFQALRRHDPALAALCAEQVPAQLKGIRQPVRCYEVRWQEEPGTGQPAQAAPGPTP
jgi:class 3 adenylate cyclase/CHASE2 domain-containing sensor protein